MASQATRSGLVALLLPLAILGLLLGCGGGGGGGGTSSTTTTTGTMTINTFYAVGGGVPVTTTPTLSPGDQVVLSVTETISGSTSAVTPYNFNVQGGSTIATVTTAGVLTAQSGIVAGRSYSVSASSTAGTITWKFVASAPLAQPSIVGVVESSVGQSGVAGAGIVAYDANGNAVGSATSASGGTFTMSVTSAAVKFSVSIGGVNQSSNTYYPYFSFGSGSYNDGASACLPSLPALNSGNHRYALPNAIMLDSDVYNGTSYPPTPPPGCFP